jgi:hypothetical protein
MDNDQDRESVTWQELFDELERCREKWAELGVFVGD